MVHNNNEQKKPNEGGDNLSSSELEKRKNDLKKAENEAIIGSSKNERTEILQELENKESHRQKELEHEMLKQTDFPTITSKNNESPEASPSDMFREINTDNFEYPFFKKYFPRLISIFEESRLGKNLFVDVGALGVGSTQSSLSALILGKDSIIDLAKFVYQPRVEYHRTKQILEDIESQKTNQILNDTIA